MTEKEANNTLYREVSKRVDEWLDIHDGETFDLDIVCRHLEIASAEGRKQAANKLRNEVLKGRLEKSNRIYRYINNNINYINWYEGGMGETYFDLIFPSNHQAKDLSYFSFQDSIRISPGSVIVVAGQTNAGKSCFARNLVWDNMDKHKIRMQVSQTSAAAFARYASNMTWSNPMIDIKTPKFELIERYEDFQDLIVPGWLNIVDWLDADKVEYYKIGALIKAMQAKVGDGVLAVMIQKNSNSQFGDGGEKSAKWADLYITLSYNREKNFSRLNIEKAKEWVGNHDPNGRVYGYEIVNYGSQLANIREVKRCAKCWGTGRDKQNNECYNCAGIGYTDVGAVTKQPKAVAMEMDKEALPF